MESYISVTINSDFAISEVLMAMLDKLGFQGIYEMDENNIQAYIPSRAYLNEDLDSALNSLAKDFNFSWKKEDIAYKNWNAEWESSFEPVEIDSRLRIRAPFHEHQSNFETEIIIEPKMSFGTGHHSTTYLMAQLLLDIDLSNKTVLDAGSGTGILSILSEKLGAAKVIGFDIEDWAYDNALENSQRNNCKRTAFYKSDAKGLPFNENTFDITLANITKNILKEDIPVYLNYLGPKGTLLISGFFEEDVEEMAQFSKELGLEVIKVAMKNNWAAIQLSR